MNDADKKAFDAWWAGLPGKDNGFEKSIAELAWQACCEWRDSQAREPLADKFEAMNANGHAWIRTITAAQLARSSNPPTVQINQQLAALLKKSLHWLDDLCDAGPLGQQYPSDELTQFVEDIRAALAATQRGGCIKHLRV